MTSCLQHLLKHATCINLYRYIPGAGEPTAAVGAALAALAPSFDKLEPAEIAALRDAAFVPVAGGAAMEAPSRRGCTC